MPRIREIRLIRPGSAFQCKRWHLGLFSFYTHSRGRRYSGLAIHVYGLAAWLAAAILAAYLSAAACLFLLWKRDPFLRITYGEVVRAPLQWNSLRTRRARASIEAGLDAFKRRRWDEAEVRIRGGLQADPALLEGRIALARFYLATGRWPAAAQVLGEGMSRGDPGRDYLAAARACALAADDLRQSSRWALLALSRRGRLLSPEDAAWVSDWAAQSLASERRCDELLNLGSHLPTAPGPEFRKAEILALITEGRAAAALDQLAQWDRADHRPDVSRDCLRAVALRQAGRLREMESELTAACSLAPRSAEVLAFAAAQRFAAGRLEAADLTLGVLMARSGRDQAALVRACRTLAETGYLKGLDRLFALARQRGLVSKQLLLTEATAHLAAGDPTGARPCFLELDQAWDLNNPREKILQRFYQLLYQTVFAPSEQSGPRLREYCGREVLQWQDFAGAAELLAKAGRTEASLQLLDLGLDRYPSSYHLAELRTRIAASGSPAKPPKRT